jgi:glycosyltransferase involved in cell wall biosynthesis
MKNKSISIAICVNEYNATVTKVIKSYLKQTLLPNNIVVVAESSVLEILQKKIGQKMLINFINFKGDKNEARNLAIANTKGEYVIYSDSDMAAEDNLLSECSKLLNDCNCLVIPEVGVSSDKLSKKLFRMEKQVVQTDPDASTPRLYKKDLFSEVEKPFDEKYGVLDEWGFYSNLKTKNPKIGVLKNSHFIVDDNFSIKERIKRSYKKGYWSTALIKEGSSETRRINPIRRGVFTYGKNINKILREPIIFVLLVTVKGIEFFTFSIGLLIGFFKIKLGKKSHDKKIN